ncbi:SDR family oxidoreductase [Mucilaginibacter aquatilis]|uniref:SDR family NAD(P)-dependent oxidoreductase n=1 Tax=Mucilaginibacter aquatilis TaxID=1517760 RepID=A0A6I4IBP9_9SPHI|nr:SDR family oxidoreductase [Mucilaginibacter aquatilis]MVN92680.1 SDR family NAD(P)-dependent oxidoreductase [Mucilaginibacter aquatilis]
MNIKEAKVIVTGATGGIGYEIAGALRRAGAEVVICGRDAGKLKKATDELDVFGIEADVSKQADIIELYRFAIEKMGSVNVLVNNAGIGVFGSLADTSAEDFQKAWEVNVKGLFLAGKEAAKYFIAQKYGNIINIGSTAALRGYANGSAYVASKFAVSGLTECWRAELRPHNVRVMQINPSEVITDFIAKAGMEIKNEDNKLKPEQIAHLAVSMLSMDDVGFIPDASVWATNPW